jgi:asparagine synthase (glutamine-hydrolysing)
VDSWPGDIDTSAIEGYLTFGYVIGPATLYRGVFKLQPGCWLRVRDGRIQTQQYWDIQEFDTDRRPVEAILRDIDETLDAAVRDRLESEVPLGAFLSGGIDSGLIVSYMANAMTTRLVTTSVGFGEGRHNELGAAGVTAAHFNSEHYVETIDPRLDATLDDVVKALGEPLADASALPTWHVSAAARRHVTVALSGDGGDESFAGYDFRYVPHAIEARLRSFIPGFAGPLLGALGTVWPRASWLPRPLRLRTMLQNLGHDPAGAYFRDLAFLKPEDTRALMGLAPERDPTTSELYQKVTDPYRRCPSEDAVQRAEYADLKIYMPNDPLVKVDRMSMAHGLEVRCPLLDRRLVQLAFRIPSSYKQRRFRGKVLLRELARRRLPGDLWRLPKKGFTAPVAEWVAGRYRAQFRDEVLGSDAVLRQHIDWRHLQRCFDEHVTGRRDHAYTLWAVWILEKWLQQQRTGPRHRERPVSVPA